MNNVIKIVKGYRDLVKKGASSIFTPIKIALFLVFILGLSFGIVYPLWSFATKDKELYSYFVIILILATLVLFLIYKTARYIYFNSFKKLLQDKIFPFLIKGTKILSVLSYTAITIFLFKYSIIYGVILLLTALVVIGYVKFVFKKA